VYNDLNYTKRWRKALPRALCRGHYCEYPRSLVCLAIKAIRF